MSRRSEGIWDQYWITVFQKAWRKGRKRPGGSERRREARDLERRCWGMGRSVWKMPVPVRFSIRCWGWRIGKGAANVQKKRPFQILRSSMVVKERPEQR